ncbi:MAG: carboxypeptidase regulatory-like domain-containing protein [Gammaproteobacteria bacterium]|nr:carboxypeptidase regulatory-like domain-containing protein [Gammaproteobacteria bacterium]
MMTLHTLRKILAGLATVICASLPTRGAGQLATEPVQFDSNDIAGAVTSADGPEAGVWVIAETADLATGFRKIVVTDDAGRYLIPDLPEASYDVWVRGYGLVDSPKVQADPGRLLDLTAVPASTSQDAAQYYPSNYWYSLLEIPPQSDFPGTGAIGNGIAIGLESQLHWIGQMKSGAIAGGCTVCHQLGNKATREIPESLGTFESSVDAWDRRVQSGQSGASMTAAMSRFGRQRALEMYADWTDRIAAGEVPPQPPRPQGIERNVVITQWDWSDSRGFVHDTI